jgi:uncharacterized protein (DUF1015 family)
VPILPSNASPGDGPRSLRGQGPADASPGGLVLAPFRGVRYARDQVSGIAEVTSPPYDVIAAEIENQLFAADPHNIVHLILPRHAAGQPGSPYSDAAAELSQWLTAGVLVPDPQPALYVYEQAVPRAASTSAGGPAMGSGVSQEKQSAPLAGSSCRDDGDVLQRGLIGALGLVPPAAGIIQPHENVAPGPVAGRRQLMEATQANLEPIFLLYEGDSGAATKLVDDVAAHREPLLTADTSDGVRHRLWAITDPAELAAVAADLAPRSALIADGHHRYAAYLQLQDRQRAAGAGPGPWDLGLAMLVDSTAYPPRIDAIHRVVTGLLPETAARLAGAAFRVRELPSGALDVPGALAELAAADGVAFLLAGAGRVFLLTDPDQRQVAAAVTDLPADLWQQVPAAVLQDLLFGRIWGIEDDARLVRALHDPVAAIEAAHAEPQGTAIICSPLSASQVYQAAALGQRVPRKSTSFGPKPRTGLVMRLFAAN